jgi:hypothetical protein
MKAAEPSMKAMAKNPGLEANVIEAYSSDAGPSYNTFSNQIWGYNDAIAKSSTRLQDTATYAFVACAVPYNG